MPFEIPPRREVEGRILYLLQKDADQTGVARGGNRLYSEYHRLYGSPLLSHLTKKNGGPGTKGIVSGLVHRFRQDFKLPAPKPGRKRGPSRAMIPTGEHSRIDSSRTKYGGLHILKGDHEALVESKSLFWKNVKNPFTAKKVLKGGYNSCKTGKRVTKGKWKGFPIFTLTLHERATCPKGCHMRKSCMGNKMPFAHRFHEGKLLEYKLAKELAAFQKTHPEGFGVRLHILGDFYSVEYVKQWEAWLHTFPALHVFGYTNWQPYDTEFDKGDIGREILRVREKHWDRFAIRFSRPRSEDGEREAVTISSTDHVPKNAILCPMTEKKTASCGTCTMCWTHDNPIAFLHHGGDM